MEYGKKSENHGKWETSTWRLEKWKKSLKNVENEKQTLYDLEYGEKNWKNMKNEKCTLKDLEYGKKMKITENEKYTL